MIHFDSRAISRELNGLTRTATLTEDILKQMRAYGVSYSNPVKIEFLFGYLDREHSDKRKLLKYLYIDIPIGE